MVIFNNDTQTEEEEEISEHQAAMVMAAIAGGPEGPEPNTIGLVGDLNEESAQEIYHSLLQLNGGSIFPNPRGEEDKEEQDIHFLISTGGGAVYDMFGIIDIHPFKDGNGRTGRIFLNIALKRFLGLPFPVVITATAQQRREYVDALKEGRTRLERFSMQQSSSCSMLERFSTTRSFPRYYDNDPPVFESLIKVVFERVLQAVKQVNTLLEEKTHAAAVEEKARIARQVREEAAASQCAICK